MNTIMNTPGTDLPAVKVGKYTYPDPDALRRYLNETYGPKEWTVEYKWVDEGIYTCVLEISGARRTAIIDFTEIPELITTPRAKFDYLFGQAAEQFDIKTGMVMGGQPAAAHKTPSEQLYTEPVIPGGPIEEATEPEEKPVEITPELTNACLIKALHSYSGSEEKWAKVRERGATDEELQQFIGHAFGEGGATDPYCHSCKGGKTPKFFMGTASCEGKPTLQGKALVKRVRELLEIPYPVKTEDEPAAEPTESVTSVAEDVVEIMEEAESGLDSLIERMTSKEPAMEPVDDEYPVDEEPVAEPIEGPETSPEPETPQAALGDENFNPFAEDTTNIFEEAAEESKESLPSGYTSKLPDDSLFADIEVFLSESPVVETSPPPGIAAQEETVTDGAVICKKCGRVVPPAVVKRCREMDCEPAHKECMVS